MAGSHRAPRAPKPRSGQGRSGAVPTWAIVVAVVAALVPALVIGTHEFLASGEEPATHSTDAPIPPVTSPTSVAPPATPSPAQTSAPPAPLPRVAAAPPRRITSGKLLDSGFDSSVATIEPASRSEVARWESRGSPGSPGTDTVYLVGEVHGSASAFGSLPDLTAGRRVSVRTDNGVLTYTVSAATLEPADTLEQRPLFKRHKPGRLVLVGIRYDDAGDRLGKALVVVAQLSGAKRS